MLHLICLCRCLSGMISGLICMETVAELNLFAAPPYSAMPWATCYATKRAAPIRIDGDLSEWKDVRAVTMAEEKYFYVGQGMSSAKWKGPQDLSAAFKVQWDSEFLYLAIEVTDDTVVEPHGSLASGTDTGSWDDDGVEIMLDTDGCGMPRYYIGDSLHHELHFVYSATHPFVFDNFWKPEPGAPLPTFKLPNGGLEPLAYAGEIMAKNDITSRFESGPLKGQFAFRRSANGYALEIRMALPGAKMAAINEGGHPIGFDLAINDNDSGSGPLKQQLHWSGLNELFWRNCQFFGTLILLNH